MEDFFVTKSGRKLQKSEIKRLGITGLYAGGKGTVCSFFGKLGACVIDTDKLARDAVKVGSQGLSEIKGYFFARGYSRERIINPDGSLNRKSIAGIVFRDKSSLEKLNAIIHPVVIRLAEEKMNQVSLKQKDAIFALNIPLLFEANLTNWVDLVIVVNTPTKALIKRGMERDGLSREEVLKRIENQIPLNEKIPLADYVIENSSTFSYIGEQTSRIWKDFKV